MTCEKCPKRETCTELCAEVKRLLDKKPEDRLYSDRHIRRMETPRDPSDFEEKLPLHVLYKKRGRMKPKRGGGDE